MQLNEEAHLEVVASGLQLTALLDTKGGLVRVGVRRRTFLYTQDSKTTDAVWLIVSGVSLLFPASKAEAMRIVCSHVALFDPALVPTLAPFWDLWDQIPDRSEAASPQGAILN